MDPGPEGSCGSLVKQLRQLMLENGALAAYLIPTDDAHQSEYIAECDKRREFISGFTGSAGIVIVTTDRALLWTDGRYHLQASKQLDSSVWTLMRQGNEGILPPEEWLASNIPNGGLIGFDPSLLSQATFLKYSKALDEGNGALLQPVDKNLVDQLWASSRPPLPKSDLIILREEFSGKCWQDKVEDVRKELKEKSASFLVVTALDEVAWLFNMRGADIDYNPVFFSYAIISMEDVRLYLSEERINKLSISDYLQGIKLFPYTQVKVDLQQLISSCQDKIWISQQSSHSLAKLVPKSRLCSLSSPIQLLKGIKNDTEIKGMRACQIRDSAALCEYLCWLDHEVPKGELDEVSAADKLESIRKELLNFVSLSFPTISSSGCNGAVIHYCPQPETARKLTTSELYLCDSGAQYLDGTTDVTRTVSFGEPSLKEKECFTLVLKGHIALCSAVFPDKTLGNQLDGLARQPLWKVGLDYKHGTGHGVGSFLNVHEGPHGISKSRPYLKPFQSGMFVTDEPGFYEDGAFGVRIENVELIKKVKTKYVTADSLTMEPLTLVPIQQKMIIVSLMSTEEIEWLNNYHATCLEVVGKYLQEKGKTDVMQWLCKETQPIKK